MIFWWSKFRYNYNQNTSKGEIQVSESFSLQELKPLNGNINAKVSGQMGPER
jgi:hypothetical protein